MEDYSNISGFASQVTILKTFFKNGKVLDLIAKSDLPSMDSGEDAMKELIVNTSRKWNDNEYLFYNTINPALLEILKKKKIPNGIPQCFLTDIIDGQRVIILENLKTKGYDLPSVEDGILEVHLNDILYCYASFSYAAVAYQLNMKQNLAQLFPDKVSSLVYFLFFFHLTY